MLSGDGVERRIEASLDSAMATSPVGGLVLNIGKQAQQVDDRIWVAPVDELWAGRG